MTLVRWDPFRELAGLQGAITRLFDNNMSSFGASDSAENQLAFPVDIKETPESVLISAELPGVKKEDIKISFNGDILTIQGKRSRESKEEGANFVRTERSFGSFSRSFTVGVPVKQADAKACYQEGILEITLPKEKTEPNKEIDIEVE